MKLGQKIFIISYCGIMISMYILGYLMISNNFKSTLDKEKNINIESHNVLRQILLNYLNMQDNTTHNDSNSTFLNIEEKNKVISGLGEEFSKNYNNNKYVQVYMNSSVIYSNVIDKTFEFSDIADNKITTYIKNQEDETVLYVISKIQIEDESFEIVTGNDISELYLKRAEEISFFVKISIILSIIISIFLFLFIYVISRKIVKLSNAVRDVANGRYDIKVGVKGHDEISVLSRGFNNMTKEINTNLEKVNQLSEARKEFIADITHEIRTPLTSIIGFSDLLKKVKITDEKLILEYADRIYSEGQYIKGLSDKLMDIVLLENNGLDLQNINLSQVLEDAYISCSYVVEPNIEFEKDIAPNVYVKADADLIKSVVINLVRNSSFACNGKNSQIKIYLDHDKFEVIDNGTGISKEQISKVLEPFYTLDKSRNRNNNGLGLGLYLCKRIVDIHSFSMDIQSKENVGTKITIYFKEDSK